MPIKGIKRVKVELEREFADISHSKTAACVEAIARSGKAMADTMTPVHLGNLINSGFVTSANTNFGKVYAQVGYTAAYAAAVHEKKGTMRGQMRPDGSGQYWDPSGEPRFLYKGFEAIEPSIPAIIKRFHSV